MLIQIPVPDWWPEGTTQLEYDAARQVFREHLLVDESVVLIEEATLEMVNSCNPLSDESRRCAEYVLGYIQSNYAAFLL